MSALRDHDIEYTNREGKAVFVRIFCRRGEKTDRTTPL